MALFSMEDFRAARARRLASEPAPIKQPRTRRRIPTGAPKIAESKRDRVERLTASGRQAFYADIVQSLHARIDLLRGRPAAELVACPWARLNGRSAIERTDGAPLVGLVPCTEECRCQATGRISIGRLLAHYRAMLGLYERLA